MRAPLAVSIFAAVALTAFPQERPGPRSNAPQTPPATPASPQAQPPAPAPKVEERVSRTEHAIQIGGQNIAYTALAGTLVLRKDDGTPTASIFYVAYTQNGADLGKRPVTFAFNGGPGSSSVWLHMGALGPRRVAMDPEGRALPPPYKFLDNPYSILDLTDVVFIDPVSTGYSRAIPENTASTFHGFTGDLQSVAEFIREYTTRNMRWGSPKFLVGESYGTTRAAALSGYLQQNFGMNLNGVLLISSVLNFGAISFDPGNDLPYILFLPTYAATAWEHKKLSKDLMAEGLIKVTEEARRYAAGPYSSALFKGDSIPAEERAAVVKNVSRLTGLPAEFVDQANLRIGMQRFAKELLRDRKRTVGRYDSRLEGTDMDAAGERPDYDPSYASVQAPFTAAWNEYVRSELKYDSDVNYEALSSKVRPWSYREFENRYVNVSEALRQAMTQNPYMKLFVACGYYDLATPFFSAEYSVDHMPLDERLRKNITWAYYEAGHMIYTDLKSLQKAKQDITKFYAASVQ
jgi:carboxypeptidase C (cathepsin A)